MCCTWAIVSAAVAVVLSISLLLCHVRLSQDSGMQRTRTLLGAGGNAEVFKAFDARPGGNWAQLACKAKVVAHKDKRVCLLQVSALRHELTTLYQMQGAYPDIPVCYPIGHSRYPEGGAEVCSAT